ncbi:hypothetical protein J437_LFUL002776, partial [Ladona fulva]
MAERLLLFRHDFSSPNILQLINSASEVTDDTTVEVVLSTAQLSGTNGGDSAPVRPHTLVVHSYKAPTFCDFCGEMLFGLVRQGLKCEGCGLNFHKRCVIRIPNNCSLASLASATTSVVPSHSPSPSTLGVEMLGDQRRRSSSSTASIQLLQVPQQQSSSGKGPRSPASDTGSNSSLASASDEPGFVTQLSGTNGGDSAPVRPHTLVVHSYKAPTFCDFCGEMLFGLVRQGLKCE